MAPLLSSSCRVLLFLPFIGACFTKQTRADGVRSELNIFHHSCALKKDEGPCKAIKYRFYFDIDTGRCELFEYGGCQGNENNFKTLQECEEMCIVKENKSPCHLEDEPGPCRGLVPRYFFDHKSQECKQFFYGGCFGNANNFNTKKECQTRCIHDVPLNAHSPQHRVTQPASQDAELTPSEVCMSPIDRGECNGSEKRFAYNSRIGKCQMFKYSGCGGNINNFAHKRQCKNMCMKDHHHRKEIRIKTRKSNILFRTV
ncbi:thrombin inhibitor hemalin-like isoform X2 [Xyrauchen texanus]|uniref:thrombin inhibitor hemalin-like isoform X2 n=1 Tax=Xyrauchen texanus TaxID=154827 RepID=UPI002241D404|nr:thrombin inhibitor hemalin-like isoform X2 [Xyrauchen texanus]